MKAFIIWYLGVGMLLNGLAIGYNLGRCPLDPIEEAHEVAITVLIWPVPVIAGLFADHHTSCKVKS